MRMTRRSMFGSSLGIASLAALAACSPSNMSASPAPSASDAGDGEGQLTFRIWDENARAPYEESLAAFTRDTGISVAIDVVPWQDYWEKLPLDIASGNGADVFWLNSASYTQFQKAGNLINVSEVLGSSAQTAWVDAVVDLYTRDGSLWGVPQFWDSIALFVNKSLVDEAGIDAHRLSFDPMAEEDSLRLAAQALTSLGSFGFNAQVDRQAIIGPFLASNGVPWQGDNDEYQFATEAGIATFDYLSRLINELRVAPSAADTNAHGDFSRELFIQGKLGLFQSGPYSLGTIHEAVGDTFEWELAPMVAGPHGSRSLVHGVVAAGNALSQFPRQSAQLLEWLGTAEGQAPLGEHGFGFPAHKEAQRTFAEYWQERGVVVDYFIQAAEDPAPADRGAKALAGLQAVMPIFQDILAGNLSAAEGVPRAQDEGNAAMA